MNIGISLCCHYQRQESRASQWQHLDPPTPNIWRVRRPSTRRFLPLLLSFRMGFPLVFLFNQNFPRPHQEEENSRVIGGRSLTFRLVGVDGKIVWIFVQDRLGAVQRLVLNQTFSEGNLQKKGIFGVLKHAQKGGGDI